MTDAQKVEEYERSREFTHLRKIEEKKLELLMLELRGRPLSAEQAMRWEFYTGRAIHRIFEQDIRGAFGEGGEPQSHSMAYDDWLGKQVDADYMNFAERYADYIALIERRGN